MAQNKFFTTKNMLLASLTILLCLLASEYLIRILMPQVTLFPRYINSTDYPIDFPANAELTHSQGDKWKFVYRTNELGRRGIYVPIRDDYDTTNVVLLGDSFTFGIGVGNEEVYSHILSGLLGNRFKVINGGMSGWGIDSEIKWYYMTGSRYKPRYVVIQFSANDPSDSFTGITKIRNGDFEFHPYPATRPDWQLSLSRSYIMQNSHLYSLLRVAYDKISLFQSTTTSSTADSHENNMQPQINYAQMLDLFVTKLHQNGVKILFLSVTHTLSDLKNNPYDLDLFPLIKQKVNDLQASGKLQFIDLPLEVMKNFSGSPEGHQWSADDHTIVGSQIANVILQIEEKR